MDKAKTHKNNTKVYEKQFVTRNSLLIDLFENDNVRTVYHMFLAIFLSLIINTAVYDFLNKGEIILGFTLIKLGFAKVQVTSLGWLTYFLGSCLTYACFNVWAKYRNTFSKLKIVRIWDIAWLLGLLAYYIFSFQSAYYLIIKNKLPPASAAIISLEQTRLLMKIHSFVRYNSPKVLQHKPHSDTTLNLPSFRYFLYFLFVPTLLYRDSYPRTKAIRWSFVLYRCLEIVAVVFFFSFIIDRFLNPSISEFGLRNYTLNELVLCIFENTGTGILILMPSFFLILHSWQNLFAELTTFGDRLFYRDWWTCTNYSDYFRKWNMIVQEWLYVHIYKDSRETLFHSCPTMSKLAVFLVSAVVHEWVLTCMFGFFMPVLFVEFVFFGSLLNSVSAPKTALFNVLFWYSISLGMGSLVTLYGVEYFARMNAGVEIRTWGDFLVPRFFKFVDLS